MSVNIIIIIILVSVLCCLSLLIGSSYCYSLSDEVSSLCDIYNINHPSTWSVSPCQWATPCAQTLTGVTCSTYNYVVSLYLLLHDLITLLSSFTFSNSEQRIVYKQHGWYDT